MVLRQKTGKFDDIFVNEQAINSKLNTGNYTILSTLERTKSDHDWEVLLGRITPYSKEKKE